MLKVEFHSRAKFPHNPILHYACRSLLTENNVENNALFLLFLGGETKDTHA